MDMGFHRRARAGKSTPNGSLDLASLLSGIAARQAGSPTARAVTTPFTDAEAPELTHPEITPFLADASERRIATAPVSFHPGVSAVILSTRKSS